jgi:hypothetical protein
VAENVGSGKLGTPWVRMHRANLNSLWRCAAVGCGGGPFGTRNRAQAFSAASATGPLKLIPLTTRAPVIDRVTPPGKPSPPAVALGFGKLVTPWVRMQRDIAAGELEEFGDSVVAPPAAPGDPLPPQAATPSTAPARIAESGQRFI